MENSDLFLRRMVLLPLLKMILLMRYLEIWNLQARLSTREPRRSLDRHQVQQLLTPVLTRTLVLLPAKIPVFQNERQILLQVWLTIMVIKISRPPGNLDTRLERPALRQYTGSFHQHAQQLDNM